MLPPLWALWHMGALHGYEQGLVLALAFGPFVVLGVVVWLRKREDGSDQAEDVEPRR